MIINNPLIILGPVQDPGILYYYLFHLVLVREVNRTFFLLFVIYMYSLFRRWIITSTIHGTSTHKSDQFPLVIIAPPSNLEIYSSRPIESDSYTIYILSPVLPLFPQLVPRYTLSRDPFPVRTVSFVHLSLGLTPRTDRTSSLSFLRSPDLDSIPLILYFNLHPLLPPSPRIIHPRSPSTFPVSFLQHYIPFLMMWTMVFPVQVWD